MKTKRVAITASDGDLFTAYKIFNLAVSAVATYSEVSIFFTFAGLNLIRKGGIEELVQSNEKIEQIEEFDLSKMMSLSSLVELTKENGIRIVACQTTLDSMNLSEEDLIVEAEVKGVIDFLDFAYNADLTLSF